MKAKIISVLGYLNTKLAKSEVKKTNIYNMGHFGICYKLNWTLDC